MTNRFFKIKRIYKIANTEADETNIEGWIDLNDLDHNPYEVKKNWEDFAKKNNLDKSFLGFDDWTQKNLGLDGSIMDGINSSISKLKNLVLKSNDNESSTGKYTGKAPTHMKSVIQTKETQAPFDYNTWKEEIGKIESGGNYKARNANSNALGKYQFVPSIWWKRIISFAKSNGIILNSFRDFLNNPKLQEDFMKYYTENDLLKSLAKLRAEQKERLPEAALLSDGRIMALFHFQGPAGARNWISKGSMIGAEINISVPQYLKRIS